MARPPGIEYPGALYPLVSSENARKDIHHDDHDRQNYLSIRSEELKEIASMVFIMPWVAGRCVRQGR